MGNEKEPMENGARLEMNVRDPELLSEEKPQLPFDLGVDSSGQNLSVGFGCKLLLREG